MTGLISGCVGSNQLSDYCENKLMNERKPHTTEVRGLKGIYRAYPSFPAQMSNANQKG